MPRALGMPRPCVCSRYASFDYEEGEYRSADLVRLDILAHGKVVDALARLVHKVPGWCDEAC